MSEIRLYGERHCSDELFDIYWAIFQRAQEEGIKKCFIELPPKHQAKCDEGMREAAEMDFNDALEVLRPRYQSANKGTLEDRKSRVAILSLWKYVLASHMGIKLICVDASFRGSSQDKLDILAAVVDANPHLYDAPLIEIWKKSSVETLVGSRRYSLEEARAFHRSLGEEIASGTFEDTANQESKRRLSDDRGIALLICQHASDDSAIGIFGKSHLDLERPDSIPNILAEMTSTQVRV
jgi:hypothetical protein